MGINALWNEGAEKDWESALAMYYNQPTVKRNLRLEKRIEEISSDEIRNMNPQEFYRFLYDEYFVWKYTAKNRLATTRKALRRYEDGGMNEVGTIREAMFYAYDSFPEDSKTMLETVKRIHGLGTAGASGLLAITFPEYYGTVDQFLVYALLKVEGLSEHESLCRINPRGITVKDAVMLEEILREKAKELNEAFSTHKWTPRKLDMVLWAADRD